MKKELKDELETLLEGEFPFLSKLCEFVAFIKEKMPQADWVGFYAYEKGEDCLYLGPFQGETACIKINGGKGVCGQSIVRRESILVKDVSKIDNYIACSSSTKSELVSPMYNEGFPIGVMDLDSDQLNAFSEEDKVFLEEAIEIFCACQ